MKVINTIKKALICTVLCLSQLVGCTHIGNKIDWESKDELIFGTTLSSKSLDPANGYCGWTLVRYGVGETLFRLDDNMNTVPWLAEEYKQINNNQWEIKIKDNIYFQNGKKLTAQAVKESINRTLELNVRAESTLKIGNIDVEQNNLIITTSEENPTLINDLCDPFVAIIDINSNEDIATKPIGTGPFKVEKFSYSGSSYFVKNANYWDGEVKLERLKVMAITDADTLAMALQSGEIDMAQGLSYPMVNLFKNDENYKVESTDTSRAVVMYFNERNKMLANASVRKAINMVIDKQLYCDSILEGQATSATGVFPSGTNYSLDNINIEKNDEEAIKILETEGYVDSNNDGILDKNGENLSLKLVTYSSRTELPIIAQAIQDDLKNIGVDIEIEISDNIMDILSLGNFDLALYSNITSATGDALAYLNNAFRSDGGSNYGGYSNDEVDKLIDELKVEFNKDKRDKLAIEIQNIALNDNSYNFIAHMKMSFVMKNNVIGIKPHSTDYYQFSANTDIE